MADEEKKTGGPPNTGDTIGALLAIVVLFVILQRVYVSIREQFIAAQGGEQVSSFFSFLADLSFWLKICAILVSAVLLAGIFHIRSKLIALSKNEKEFYFPEGVSDISDTQKVVDSKWDKVIEHADSDNPNDWKVAILEADIILGDMLDHLGYVGDSIGEKLKQVEKSDFLTLDKAWEAHKVRNAIAHEGGQFLINHREVLRILELYKDVFDEFYYV